jgi:error-prone DNA polymerase
VRDANAAARLAQTFGRDRFFVELQRPFERGDVRRNSALRDLAETLGVATVVTGDPHAHAQSRVGLQDVLVAIHNRTSLDGCERERRGNHESVLLAPAEMYERFPGDQAAVARTAGLAQRLEFDLTEELGYRYPDFSDGDDPAIAQLTRICDRAFADRYGTSASAQARLRERTRSDRPHRSWPASSCSTGRCSSSRARSRWRCEASRSRGTRCRRGAVAARRSARSSAT